MDIIILWLLKLGITMLIHNKDDIEFVTEFPCLLGHPVDKQLQFNSNKMNEVKLATVTDNKCIVSCIY